MRYYSSSLVLSDLASFDPQVHVHVLSLQMQNFSYFNFGIHKMPLAKLMILKVM